MSCIRLPIILHSSFLGKFKMVIKSLVAHTALGLCVAFSSVAHAEDGASVYTNVSDASSQAIDTVDANIAGSPEQVVQTLIDEAISSLSTQTLTKENSEALFDSLFTKYFDIKGIAKFALGRYWKLATPAQKTEYTSLFHGVIVGMYSERLREYSGEKFTIQNTKMVSEKDAVVSGILVSSKAAPAKVDWRLRNRDGVWRIMDVSVENVSMALTQRSEFASVIERRGGKVEALLSVLRTRAVTKDKK
jgi:phospholipid transport system substrate-binding protein